MGFMPPPEGFPPGTLIGSASLAFYLTRHLTREQDEEIRREIERQEQHFEKLIYYHTWTNDADGTLDDVERIAAQVKGDDRFAYSPVVYFIDQQSGIDRTVWIVALKRGAPSPSVIKTRGRLIGRHAHCAVINELVSNCDLVEYLEDPDPQNRATLEFHHESESEADCDLEAAPNTPPEERAP